MLRYIGLSTECSLAVNCEDCGIQFDTDCVGLYYYFDV